MSKKGTEILEEGLSLPASEWAEVVDRLLASLEPSSQSKIDELWGQEAEERIDAFERGEIKSVSAAEVFGAIQTVKP